MPRLSRSSPVRLAKDSPSALFRLWRVTAAIDSSNWADRVEIASAVAIAISTSGTAKTKMRSATGFGARVRPYATIATPPTASTAKPVVEVDSTSASTANGSSHSASRLPWPRSTSQVLQKIKPER